MFLPADLVMMIGPRVRRDAIHLDVEINVAAHALAHELLHGSAQARQVAEQFLEGFAGNGDDVEWGGGADRGVARLMANKRRFTKDIAIAERGYFLAIAFDRG